jgi:glycosyltransferase involved in cell wall biosynthesis
MKSMAILTQYYLPEIGAPQNRLFEMALGLKQNGWEIAVITGMPNYPTGKIFETYKGKFFFCEYINNILIRRHWLFPSNSKKILPRIISMITFSIMVFFSINFLRKRKFDFIFIESPPLLLGISGYILSKLLRTKLILNVSDLWPLSAKELKAISDGFIYRKLECIERFLYKKAYIILGQSQQIIDYIKARESNKTYLFRNGVDPNRFIRKLNNKNVHKLSIVYTGLLGVAQGILHICKNINFKDLGLEFHIYGDGSERIELESFLKNNPNSGIFYHGVVTSNEIPNILRNHSATLIALTAEIYGAIPSKIYESMAAGLPIIFSGDGEGRMIIEKYDLGWTSSVRDYFGLKRNIEIFKSDLTEYKRKSDNCIIAAKNEFNRPKQIVKLNKFLESHLTKTSANLDNN